MLKCAIPCSGAWFPGRIQTPKTHPSKDMFQKTGIILNRFQKVNAPCPSQNTREKLVSLNKSLQTINLTQRLQTHTDDASHVYLPPLHVPLPQCRQIKHYTTSLIT
ncbi:hypothetical protein TNCV_1339461 [Trichonephila clavipes]|uniref:Uncharacterized protein n=1 Tax=Trichonephila clavipes TaxID=2585209 RepID=A0A8X6RGX5_TRICX|nr:hypothetical protein TNCV_1339461 [Trichonephila clavipes]